MTVQFRPLVNPEWLFATIVADGIMPPPPPDFLRWAVEHVRFGSESQFPGPYDPDRFPFFTRILEVLSPEHPARVVAVMKSAQLGGSVICQIFVAASLDLDPCQILYYHPTEPNAKEWARLKWRPMLRQSDRLRDVVGGMQTRESTQNILYYERLDGRGSLTVSGANSGAAVSMKSARVQVQDDLAKWEILTNSGDSETQADDRSSGFLFPKILKNSTPLLAHNCRITKNFKAGTQEYFHVPCPHCDLYQKLEWANMLASLDPEDPAGAHFTCIGCGEAIEHRHKTAIVARGSWVAENPGAYSVSFHLWAAYSPLKTWESIARAWLSAEGNPAAEQGFTNNTLGLPFEAAGESPPWEEIRDRAKKDGHRLGLIPTGGLIFTAGADCQIDRVEVHLKTFGAHGRRWTVQYIVIEGHISTDKARDELDRLLTKTWPDAYGNARPLDMLSIDGNAWTEDVMGWARRHSWNRVIVTRGAKSENAPPLVPVQSERKPDGKPRKAQKRFWNLGVSGLKSTLYTALPKADPLERGFCGYPKGLEDDFFQQLCAERREAKRGRDGFVAYRWVKDATQRNEVLDTELIAEGAAIRLQWRAMTDEAAAELEGRLIATGQRTREGAQLDLLDPATPILAAATNAVREEQAPPAPAAAGSADGAAPSAPSREQWLPSRSGSWLGRR
ncbi:MAG: phage terminase large subunit family protein [Inquilinus sp.]|uniref:phage terminase large subunit family protein n=1 Tax=Inquilinus sp. TaxID=1932117 RepID=UPI003F3FF6EA